MTSAVVPAHAVLTWGDVGLQAVLNCHAHVPALVTPHALTHTKTHTLMVLSLRHLVLVPPTAVYNSLHPANTRAP